MSQSNVKKWEFGWGENGFWLYSPSERRKVFDTGLAFTGTNLSLEDAERIAKVPELEASLAEACELLGMIEQEEEPMAPPSPMLQRWQELILKKRSKP